MKTKPLTRPESLQNRSFTDLGQIYLTCGVAEISRNSEDYARFIMASLVRYRACDWGDLCKSDKERNDLAIIGTGDNADRVLARYNHPAGNIWIITEWNRSATTILLPSEY
jgi:hypothetical protein